MEHLLENRLTDSSRTQSFDSEKDFNVNSDVQVYLQSLRTSEELKSMCWAKLNKKMMAKDNIWSFEVLGGTFSLEQALFIFCSVP